MNKYFIKRGNKSITIDFNNEKLDIEIKIPTNREHDEMMEEFSEVGADGMLITHGAQFIEERLIRFIINLPFLVPKDENFEECSAWDIITTNEKRNAIRLMDPILRDLINNSISGIEDLSEDEAGN